MIDDMDSGFGLAPIRQEGAPIDYGRPVAAQKPRRKWPLLRFRRWLAERLDLLANRLCKDRWLGY